MAVAIIDVLRADHQRICYALRRGLRTNQMRCSYNYDRYCGMARAGTHLFVLLNDAGRRYQCADGRYVDQELRQPDFCN